MRVVVEQGAYAPERAHSTDAGLDLRALAPYDLCGHESALFDTGVHVELPPNTAGVLISKSGLNVKHNITSTGLIDEGYTGSIRVKLYNHGDETFHIAAGDKISQLMIVPVLYEPVEIVDELEETVRGNNGFGSTGR